MEPYFADDTVTLWHGDALEVLTEMQDGSIDCVVTSPPYYGLRDYGTEGQYGLEESPAAYVETMRVLFAEARRVLADDGTFWLNIGDSYATNGRKHSDNGTGKSGLVGTNPTGERWLGPKLDDGAPAKNLMGIPWRVAFALQDDGWILRNDIIWAKPNGMPESVTDRLSSKHEHLFLFTKSPRYWFDLDPIREPLLHPDALARDMKFGGKNAAAYGNPTYSGNTYGKGHGFDDIRPQSGRYADPTHQQTHPKGRNPGDVWTIPTQPYPGAHFAVMPQQIASRAIQAGCKPGGTVLDPFSGSGTTGLAAAKHGRKYVGIDLNSDYLDLSLRTRLTQPALMDLD